MTALLFRYLVRPTMGVGGHLVDGVTGAIVVMDSATFTTAATQQAQAAALINASLLFNLPLNYFTSSVALDATAATDEASLVNAGDYLVFSQFRVVEKISSTVTDLPVK